MSYETRDFSIEIGTVAYDLDPREVERMVARAGRISDSRRDAAGGRASVGELLAHHRSALLGYKRRRPCPRCGGVGRTPEDGEGGQCLVCGRTGYLPEARRWSCDEGHFVVVDEPQMLTAKLHADALDGWAPPAGMTAGDLAAAAAPVVHPLREGDILALRRRAGGYELAVMFDPSSYMLVSAVSWPRALSAEALATARFIQRRQPDPVASRPGPVAELVLFEPMDGSGAGTLERRPSVAASGIGRAEHRPVYGWATYEDD